MKLKRGITYKKSQELFGMPFSVIFSIIIIIFFMVVAGIAIKHFLDIGACAKVGIFIQDFQKKIDEAWNSEKASFEFKGVLPGGIDYICFANLSETINGNTIEKEIAKDISVYKYSGANFFLYPREKSCDMPYHRLKHINLEETTSIRNPYCIKTKDNMVSIKIEMGLNEHLVKLS